MLEIFWKQLQKLVCHDYDPQKEGSVLACQLKCQPSQTQQRRRLFSCEHCFSHIVILPGRPIRMEQITMYCMVIQTSQNNANRSSWKTLASYFHHSACLFPSSYKGYPWRNISEKGVPKKGGGAFLGRNCLQQSSILEKREIEGWSCVSSRKIYQNYGCAIFMVLPVALWYYHQGIGIVYTMTFLLLF